MPSFDTGPQAPVLPQRSSRLTYRRLRHPTPLPTLPTSRPWRHYLARLAWLFS
ncbi:MAG: hypothetical protein ACSLE9_11640 [Burkholderiaceae bacterium]